MTYLVEMNEWGCGLYSGAGNLLTFVPFCDKNTGVRVFFQKIPYQKLWHNCSLFVKTYFDPN